MAERTVTNAQKYWLSHAERAVTSMRFGLEEFFVACAEWNVIGDNGVVEIAVKTENNFAVLEGKLKELRNGIEQGDAGERTDTT